MLIMLKPSLLLAAMPRQLETPLHVAAEYGMAESVKLLIAARADVNAKTVSSYPSPCREALGF